MPTPKKRKPRPRKPPERRPPPTKGEPPEEGPSKDFSTYDKLPVTYQELHDLFSKLGEFSPFELRRATMRRISAQTKRPLICYVARTTNVGLGMTTSIDDSDLVGFTDLISSVSGTAVDVFLVSNGGSAEATERIARLLRDKFSYVRVILPANAYSAATLLSFSADEMIMDAQATLGPIDPQINGIPARAILRAIENLEERLKQEGPRALPVYVPLLEKLDLHILEICKSAQELSEELARTWISRHMLKCAEDDPRVNELVEFFSSYDLHKSHGRSIGRAKARELGLPAVFVEDVGLDALVRSLYNQYDIWFNMSPFYKMFENAEGVNWGRQVMIVPAPAPPSG